MTQRVSYTMDDKVLARFNALVPPHRRSKTVQDLIAKHVDDHERRLIRAANLIETHPDFTALREASEDACGFGFETLTRLETNE